MAATRGRAGNRQRGLAWALAAALIIAACAPAAASAGQGVWVTVHNSSSANVTLVAPGGSNCWEPQGLAHPLDQSFVAPGASLTYGSEKETGGRCHNSDAHLNAQFQVKEATGGWYPPFGSPENYRFYWQDGENENFGVNFYDGLGTWLPRTDGRGLICFHGAIKDANHADLWVYSDERCNVAVPTTIQHSNSPKPPIVGQGRGGGARTSARPATAAGPNEPIVDLLSMIGIACPWYAYPGQDDKCKSFEVGNEAKWVLDNVPSEIREFKVTAQAGASDEKTPVGTETTSLPPEALQSKVVVEKALGTTESNATTTQRGWKIGAKFGFKQTAKAKIPFFGEGGVEFSQEISGEYNYTKSETSSTTKTDTRKVLVEVGAKPGFITTLEVFTSKRNANYIYEADLSFGAEGVAKNVTTPANLALNQSPALRQPCLAYVVGDGQVRNSIVNIGQTLINSGKSPDDSSLPIEQRVFLGAISGFKTGKAPCPGFPGHYASAASFKGTGIGSYENLGYDEKGNPVQVMVACVYIKPYVGRAAAASAASTRRARVATARTSATDSPCKKVPPGGGEAGVEAPGVLLDHRKVSGTGSGRGSGPLTSGTRGSDRILGPRGGGVVRTGNGAVDIVKAGKGDTRIYGEGGENVLFGNDGDDLLVGGRGMSYIHAGPGRDRLVDSNGAAVMYGEGGHDTFEGHSMKGVMFGGGGNNRMIASGDLSGLSMTSGGKGDNVYVLKGSGVPSIVQLPGPGRATVITDRSLDVPPNVDVARAIGARRLTLRGGETGKLVAGKAGGVLVSGPAPTYLRGRGGDDTIVFNAENSNVAAGGAGADRYVFTGTPERVRRPRALERPANRTASLISDFDPEKGDRLVLHSSVFGSPVVRLRQAFTVVANQNPWPKRGGPTLLLDTGSGVLSFDRDGTGPVSDKVIVRLPGRQGVERGWFEIRRG